MKVRLVRVCCEFPYKILWMCLNFAAVNPKTLKLPKITYFVLQLPGNVRACFFFLENLTKQKITGRLLMNVTFRLGRSRGRSDLRRLYWQAST